MEEKSLIRKRGSLKACLTNFNKFIQQFKQKDEILTSLEANLVERLERIQHLFIEFNEVQQEIENIVDEDRLDEQYQERVNFEDNYFASVSLAKSLLPPEHLDQRSSESLSNSSKKASTNKIGVKLPDISLPTFDGSYKRWLEFRDTFESLINKNDELSSIQKFHYLRASLKGKASDVIKSVEFSEDGYTVAWKALVGRYDNKKLLVHNHLKAIFSLESVNKETSVKLRGLVDEFTKHLNCLKQLGQDTSNWDTLLIYILNSKLDQKAVIDWERSSIDCISPTLDEFLKFLRNRGDVLETIEYKSGNSQNRSDTQDKKYKTQALFVSKFSCYYCNEEHSIYSCTSFANLSAESKMDFVKKKKLCVNCLRDNHFGKKCRMGPCRKCRAWHNSLLHPDNRPSNNEQQQSNNSVVNEHTTVAVSKQAHEGHTLAMTEQVNQHPGCVFLSTARVRVYDKHGQPNYVRALLDCGSQSSFISAELCKRLGLETAEANLSVLGIGNLASSIKYKCLVEISSLYSKFQKALTCFVLPVISSISYSSNIDFKALNIPPDVKLADPDFLTPGTVDILIGAELFWVLLERNRISCGKNLPVLQETTLGWILAGIVSPSENESKSTCCFSTANYDLQQTVSKFWEIEEMGVLGAKPMSKEEMQCERIFTESTSRDSQDRFIVRIPLKQTPESLGESRGQAKKSFYSLERKLGKNAELREYYVNFMQEYEQLNHMTRCEEKHEIEYFMPHHGVFRETSKTTKLRVVFNASAPTSNGLSLNNIQLVGPVLQNNLLSILLRFRKHKFVVSADVAKMYRQVLIEPSQRVLQKIFWRSNPSEDLKAYTLNTVTYGHASASFLAIRCLVELANNSSEENPDIADIIRNDFYVDDMLTGADTIEHAQRISQEVLRILKNGCFELRKWYSNNPEVLEPMLDTSIPCGILAFAPEENAKTLGLTWCCQRDVLVYNVAEHSTTLKITKRSVLSLIARIFDPLGLLSPCTIMSKIFMQRLWLEKISWDEPLPQSLSSEWANFRDDLTNLNKLEIDRRVVCSPTSIELHGFADASEKAYGACIYVRSRDESGNINVRLLCAKSKVAPIKSLTIPKLELCAALLLARLAHNIIESMQVKFDECVFWSDSTITLAWLQTSPNLLEIFVGNRVAEIQSLTENHEWRYVPSEDNPADLVSRGLFPCKLLKALKWWHGPTWLLQESAQWPSIKHKVENLPDLKPPQISAFPASTINSFPFERFSSLLRLQRTTAYILRFKLNCFRKKSERVTGLLSLSEMRYALDSLIKAAQSQSFPEELLKLSKGHSLSPSNKMSSLSPFLDHASIIRVGGRLKHSDFPAEKKHPIILSAKHPLTKLIFEYEHICLLHPGPQMLLSYIRETFWPIAGRDLARITTKKCLRCFRFSPKSVVPIMGNLPRERTVPMSPFYVTGIDYAGPFLIKRNKRTTEKCYIGVFVCFSTKALHLELISSLSSQSFIQALRRFAARRGKPSKLFSDNGTTFVGANKELGQFLKHNKAELESLGAIERIEWSFIPPYSPHFGGLWESGVKSVKHHLKRFLANASLSFEEFNTVLCQIEAILNSRPLCPLSSDPNDLVPLTPAHLLIGRPMVAVPDGDLQDKQVNRLTRYQYLQQICQHFWRRWKLDYISELQQRSKWKSQSSEQLTEGMMVLIKEDHTQTMEWKLGRIISLHPGSDGISRVATIRTSQNIVKRSFAKVLVEVSFCVQTPIIGLKLGFVSYMKLLDPKIRTYKRNDITVTISSGEEFSLYLSESTLFSYVFTIKSCTVLCSAAVILLILAVFFGLLGHCNNDNKIIIACGLFILGGLALGCGLISFVSSLSATLAEIYEYHKDGPSGPDYDYKYGWCFFTASVALVLTYISSALSFVGYLNRYSSINEMVCEMVPGADRKLREHKLSTEYLIRHTNPHPQPHQQYDTMTTEQQIPLESYEAAECGPLLNKTPPDVCTTNRCQEFAAASDLSNAGALEINFCMAGASCNAHSQALVGQTIPITIKNHNSTAPLSFSNIPVSKYGTMPHGGTTLHQGFLGVSDMGSSSSNSSSGYCGKSKTLQHQRTPRIPAKKCVKIETFQVPETNFEGFGKQRPNSNLSYSGSAV